MMTRKVYYMFRPFRCVYCKIVCVGLVIISDDGDDTSSYTNGSGSPEPQDDVADIGHDEKEEKARLISQVLELQNTLDGKDLLSFSFH